VAVAGNVSGGMVGTFTLPPGILKYLQQPVHRPAALPSPEVLADRGSLPPGSHVPFSANAIFTGRREYLGELARELLYAWGNTESPGRLASGPGMLRASSEDIPRKARRGSS